MSSENSRDHGQYGMEVELSEESNSDGEEKTQSEKKEENELNAESEDEKMEVEEPVVVRHGEDEQKEEYQEKCGDDEFEFINENDCIPEGDFALEFNAATLFENAEPDDQFLIEKRLSHSAHKAELRDAAMFYYRSENKSVKTAAKQAFKIHASLPAKFPTLDLFDKGAKAKRFVKRTHVRHDGMKRLMWEQEADAFVNNPAVLQRNQEHKELLNLTDEEYQIFFRKNDLEQLPPEEDRLDQRRAWPKEIADSKRQWTLEETRYLIGLYHKYTTRWAVIADQYSYKGMQRSVYEIKTRYFFVFDLMCFVRDKRHLMSEYDPDLEYTAKKRREMALKISPQTQNRIAQLERELLEISPADLEPPPRPPPVIEIPAPVQKSLTTGRSSSSVPPSRMPSVPKIHIRANLDQSIDYNKKIEAASDVAFLRFFSFQIGPHLRSQEYKLVSNVNPKKRANIENVIEGLGLLRRTVYTELVAKYYKKLSTNINIISELKAVYRDASAECMALHSEYCEKAGEDLKFEIPQMPQAIAENRPSICSLAEAPGQNAFNKKRI